MTNMDETGLDRYEKITSRLISRSLWAMSVSQALLVLKTNPVLSGHASKFKSSCHHNCQIQKTRVRIRSISTIMQPHKIWFIPTKLKLNAFSGYSPACIPRILLDCVEFWVGASTLDDLNASGYARAARQVRGLVSYDAIISKACLGNA